MEVLILTVFVSVLLVATELLFFTWNLRQGTHEHSDRMSLLPLEDDAERSSVGSNNERRA